MMAAVLASPVAVRAQIQPLPFQALSPFERALDATAVPVGGGIVIYAFASKEVGREFAAIGIIAGPAYGYFDRTNGTIGGREAVGLLSRLAMSVGSLWVCKGSCAHSAIPYVGMGLATASATYDILWLRGVAPGMTKRFQVVPTFDRSRGRSGLAVSVAR